MKRFGTVFLVVFMLLGLVLVPASQVLATASAPDASSKIAPDLLHTLQQSGSADLVIKFDEQADLSAAYGMDWEARGEFVYRALTETAQRTQAKAIAALDARGLKHQTFYAGNTLYVWAGDLDAAIEVATLSEVRTVRAAFTIELDQPFKDPLAPQDVVLPQAVEWNVSDIGAPAFWSTYGVDGDGIVVAEVGTGVLPTHNALTNQYHCGADYSNPACWYDPANICGGSVCDNTGLGTAITGVMVGDDGGPNQIGVAPDAEWISCKACESSSCSETSRQACWDWILAPGGSWTNRPHIAYTVYQLPTGGDDIYLDEVAAWRAAGIFPAFGAGTGGPACSSLRSPADYQGVFAAGGYDSTHTIGSWSSRGPSTYGHEPYTKPNIAAPGANIRSATNTANNAYTTLSGTSMSGPHGAAAAALLWSCQPSLKGQVDVTMALLQQTASLSAAGSCGAPPDGEGNYTYGYGLLNVSQAGAVACQGWEAQPAAPFDYTRHDCVWFDDGSGVSAYNQKVYCMGGRIGSPTESPDIWRYDPVTDTWQDTTADMVEDVSNYTALTLRDENYATRGLAIYVLGGYDADTAYAAYNLIQRYYPGYSQVVETIATDPWNETVSGIQVYAPGCVSVNNKIYCMGGWEVTSAPYYSASTWMYDPYAAAGSRWTKLTSANLSVPRSYIQVAAQGNKIYAMGGDFNYSGSDITPTDVVEVLDLTNLAAGWQLLKPLPTITGEGRGGAWHDGVYVVGGGDWPSQSGNVFRLDTKSNKWWIVSPLNQARRNLAAVVVPLCTRDPTDGLPGIWVFGGRTTTDMPPFGTPEYYPLQCLEVFVPFIRR